MRKQAELFAGVLAALLGLGLTGALLAGQDRKTTADKEEGPDRAFLIKAASMSMKEAQVSQTGIDQAKVPAVKKYAARMFKEHKAMDRELGELVGKWRVPLPKGLDKTTQAKIDWLIQIKGIDFDRTYMKEQIEDHLRAIELFEAEARHGQDPDVKAFAARSLPMLREHLKLARSVAEQVPPPEKR